MQRVIPAIAASDPLGVGVALSIGDRDGTAVSDDLHHDDDGVACGDGHGGRDLNQRNASPTVPAPQWSSDCGGVSGGNGLSD